MIYTFYSYKGGVGRSMALANLGMYFFKNGYTTILLDLDLEAPGLESYFEERYRLNLEELHDRPGFCDMLQAYQRLAASAPTVEDTDSPFPAVEDYLYQLDQQPGCQLLLMHAGRRATGQAWQNYASFVRSFDWTAFYEEWEGGRCLEWLRTRLKDIADVVLIDSRTGVTEMGGVATQHLADVVVMLCGANLQNIENTARMGHAFTSDAVYQARDDRPLDLIVVPSRIDDADSSAFLEFQQRLDTTFSDLPLRFLDDGYTMHQMCLPYLPIISYEETLVVGNPEMEQAAGRLHEAYQRVAANMRALAHKGTTLQSGTRSAQAPAQLVVYLANVRDDQAIADQSKAYLTQHGVVVRDTNQLKQANPDALEDFARADTLVMLLSKTASMSRTMQRLCAQADDLAKPIIPLKLDDSPLPYWLADRLSIDVTSDIQQRLPTLLESIQAQREASRRPDEPHGQSGSMVYICYSVHDGSEAASRIAKYLRTCGFQTWLDHENLLPGASLQAEINRAIDTSDAVVILLSPALINSDGAQREWSYMRQLKKPLFPVIVSRPVQPARLLADLQWTDLTLDFDHGLQQLAQTLKKTLPTQLDMPESSTDTGGTA